MATSWRDPGGPLASALAERFASESAQELVASLNRVGIAAHVAASIDDAIAYLHGRGVVYFEAGVGGQQVARPGIGRCLSATPPRVGPNPAPVGSQALEILGDLGVTDEEIEELARQNVVCLPDKLPQLQIWN